MLRCQCPPLEELSVVYRQTERSGQVRAAARTRILESARQLFGERGCSACTVQDVVDAAGTSVGNFYFYFENKAALQQTVLEGILGRAWKRGEEVMSRAPAGVPRIAAMVYGNLFELLGSADPTRVANLLTTINDAAIEQHLSNLNMERVRKVLREAFPRFSESRLDFVATAWAGAERECTMRAARKLPSVNLSEVAEQLVRWNLRALGVPQGEIDAAVAFAEQAFAGRMAGAREE
jgi:AcrR family transcriptional regulator